MTAGTLPMSLTQVKAPASNVTITATNDLNLSGTSTATATNGNAQITSGGNIQLSAAQISLLAGTAPSAFVNISTTNGGFIAINSTGPIQMQGGIATSGASDVTISTLKGGAITIDGTLISMLGGSGRNAPIQLMTAVGSGNGNIAITGTSITSVGLNPSIGNAQVLIQTGRVGTGTIALSSSIGSTSLTNTQVISNGSTGNSNSLTVTSADDITLVGSLLKTMSGNITLAAVDSVTFDLATELNATATQPTVLIRTNANNTSPMASFVYPIGAKLFANKGTVGKGFVRIYTVSQTNNMVTTGANINGLNYVPAMMDTPHERFNVTYPTVPAAPGNGSDHYTIYYQSP